MRAWTFLAAATVIVGLAGAPGSTQATGVAAHTFLGCPYPNGDVWQRSVANDATDPRGADWIAATIAQGDGREGFAASIPTNERINEADDTTPQLAVAAKVKWHRPYSPIPWNPSFYIEPLSDHHAMVLQKKSCQYYESYQTSYAPGGGLAVYSNLHIDLTKPFVRPLTGGSTASGIPIGLVAVRPEELAAGVIHHALGWDAVEGSLSQTACVSPAGVSDCTDDVPYRGPAGLTPMPYGAHARLKPSFNIDGFSREAKIVAQAMKTYGLFVYDTGCCNEVVFVDDVYGAPLWTNADAADLRRISPQDLEIVPPPQR
jgi:hypothetical protein